MCFIPQINKILLLHIIPKEIKNGRVCLSREAHKEAVIDAVSTRAFKALKLKLIVWY